MKEFEKIHLIIHFKKVFHNAKVKIPECLTA